MKPVSVTVHSSPNHFFFEKNAVYSYADFERIMRAAALEHQHAGDYSPSDVTILFDNDFRLLVHPEISPVGDASLKVLVMDLSIKLAAQLPADLDFAPDAVKAKADVVERIRSIEW